MSVLDSFLNTGAFGSVLDDRFGLSVLLFQYRSRLDSMGCGRR